MAVLSSNAVTGKLYLTTTPRGYFTSATPFPRPILPLSPSTSFAFQAFAERSTPHHLPLLLLNRRRRRLSPLPVASASCSDGVPALGGMQERAFLQRLRAWVELLPSLLPGGSWWRLDQEEDEDKRKRGDGVKGKAVTLVFALGRIWVMVAKERWIILVAFVSLIVAVGDIQTYPLYHDAILCRKPFFSSFSFVVVLNHLSDLAIPHFLAASIFSAQGGQSGTFYRNARVLVLLCLSSGICSGLRGCCFGLANMLLVKRMRETLYSSLLFQDVSFFDEETVGDLTSRLGADCQQVSRVIGNDLNLILRSVLQGSGALIYLLILSWPLALSALTVCSVLSMIMLFYGRYQKRAAKLTQEFTACSNEVAQETLSLIRTVRVYGTENEEFERYMKWLKKLANLGSRQSIAYGFWSLSFSFLYHSTQVIAVLIGGMAVMSGHISAEKLTKYILYIEWLIYSTWWLGDNWSSLMQSIGASEKIFELMDLLPSKQFLSEGGLKLEKIVGRIDFVDVCFYYPSRMAVPALQHIKLRIKPNEVVAIVGLSGSGKSTLVNLLLRLYEPTFGQILVDGVPLQDLDIRWFRERIGYVEQEPRLFRTDVSSNIMYGCNREVSHDEVEWVAKQAFVHEFISSLPSGYQTLVDDSLLSGGQKQRIAIARAILRDPKILILDEATSALDAESEYNLKGVIRAVQNGTKEQRTVIIIAHRLSTIQVADRIVVMDGGRIVEMGNHLELIKEGGLYARLISRQAEAFT